jgi:hypothetical protein
VTPAANHGRESPALDPQSLRCELYIIHCNRFQAQLTALCLFPDALCNGYPYSKLPGLGLSGTLAYNMNTMDSLVEL